MDSDPDIEFIEKDSGMSSLGGSKDETPERRTEEKPTSSSTIEATTSTTVATKDAKDAENIDNYDDEPDETLGERLMGLTEMFPDRVRNFTGNVVSYTTSSVKMLYSFTCNASWIFFTSSVILFAPVIFETERAQMDEVQKSQQKQVLLGPSSAIAAAGPPAAPAMTLMY